MRNALLAVAVVALSWNAYTMDALRQTPTSPPWVEGAPDEICEPVSLCNLPTEVFEAVQLSIAWYEADGVTPCPSPAVDEHPQTPCGPDPQIRQWVALSRGGPAWLPSRTSTDIFVSQGAIYSGGPNPTGIAEYNGHGFSGEYAMGAVVTFMLPAPPPVQQGAVTVLTEAEVDARIAVAIAAIPGGLTQAQFDAMLASSPYAAFADPVTGHTHTRPDLTITRAQSLDGVAISLPPTGPPQ